MQVGYEKELVLTENNKLMESFLLTVLRQGFSLNASPSPSLQTLEIGLNGIIKQFEALNSNKAPAKILKETAKKISPIISHMFRQMSE